MAKLHSRRLKDANFISTALLAQAGAASRGFDLDQVDAGVIEGIQLEVAIPAVPGIADGKVLTFTLEDSTDGVTFAAVDPLQTTTVVGAGGAGSPAKVVELRFPPSVRRYVRMAQTASASAGTFTGSVTVALLF